ncbi:MAG: hypothetical protein Q9M09_06580 [Mariprofundaceae bacterium]|nr:hypothetical protein [Mariprofundaceae bacterium]
MTRWLLPIMCLLYLVNPLSAMAAEEVVQAQQGDISLMQQFDDAEEIAPERAISEKRKHQILFFMGASLLLLLLLTGGLGLAMGIWEKDVFVWHMLSAGLTVTLAITHAVVSFVWFYPS